MQSLKGFALDSGLEENTSTVTVSLTSGRPDSLTLDLHDLSRQPKVKTLKPFGCWVGGRVCACVGGGGGRGGVHSMEDCK